jgi:hypothetical protein
MLYGKTRYLYKVVRLEIDKILPWKISFDSAPIAQILPSEDGKSPDFSGLRERGIKIAPPAAALIWSVENRHKLPRSVLSVTLVNVARIFFESGGTLLTPAELTAKQQHLQRDSLKRKREKRDWKRRNNATKIVDGRRTPADIKGID